jgi:hypothetical protein
LYQSILFDDFWEYTDTQLWTKFVDNATGVGMAGDTLYQQNGILIIQRGTANDNEQALVYTTNNLFGFRTDQTFGMMARYKTYDANSNGNYFFGFLEDPGEDMLLDDGGGVVADKDVAAFYSIDGEANWRCLAGQTSTRQDTLTEEPANTTTEDDAQTSRADFKTLHIRCEKTGAELNVNYFIDTDGFGGFQALADPVTGRDIKHVIRSDSAVAQNMKLAVAMKFGAAAGGGAIHLDWILAYTER